MQVRTYLTRGIRRRCPRCGGKGLFESAFKMKDDCPACGWHFERVAGYWLGAMTINLAAAMISFALAFGGGLLLTWPDVPWTRLTVIVGFSMVVVPILTWKHSRTMWMAADFAMHSDEPEQLPPV